jgi:hypothetical protein
MRRCGCDAFSPAPSPALVRTFTKLHSIFWLSFRTPPLGAKTVRSGMIADRANRAVFLPHRFRKYLPFTPLSGSRASAADRIKIVAKWCFPGRAASATGEESGVTSACDVVHIQGDRQTTIIYRSVGVLTQSKFNLRTNLYTSWDKGV